MSSIATIAAVASAAIGAGSLAYGVVQGQAGAHAQDQAVKRQKAASQQAIDSALSTERQSSIAQNAANRKTPDIATILQRAQAMSKAGAGSTMLTGSSGVDPSQLNLGNSTLLGK